MKFDPEKLIEARWAKRMKQSEVARAIGVNQSLVCNWEKGRQNPSAITLLKLSDVLQVEPVFFYAQSDSSAYNKGA